MLSQSPLNNPNYRELMNYAMRALTRRAHTVSEMEKKLAKRPHFEPKLAKQVIARLLEIKLLDDEAYIHRFIESATEFRHQGLHKVAQRLQKKGIPYKQVQQIWEGMKIDEKALAQAALKKYEKRLHNTPKEKRYQKRAQHLASRGFSPQVVYALAKDD